MLLFANLARILEVYHLDSEHKLNSSENLESSTLEI